MYSDTIARYIDAISKTKRGLRVLIADDLIVEQLAFLEIIRHYLPDSTAKAVDRSELEAQLNQEGNGYDLVILEEGFLLNKSGSVDIRQVRNNYPKAKIALFVDRENLHQLKTAVRFPDIDIIFTKCSTVEAIAEKLCMTFQEAK